MLQTVVQLSLRFRGIVVVLACLALGYGIYTASHAQLDVFPDFVPPQVTVQTEAPGLSPEQVEALVTRPVETAINGLGRLESLRSESIQGLSVVTVVFTAGTPILPARQLLAEKLGAIAGSLPAGVAPSKMSPLTSATMDLLKIGLRSEKLSPRELRTFADWTLKPRLLAVPGVAGCSVFGGEVRQWQIHVHPTALVRHGITLTQVLEAAQLASGVRGAGFIDTPNQRVVIQSESPDLTAVTLGGIVVAMSAGGVPIRLQDVGGVGEGAEPKFGDTLIMGKPGVLLAMTSQYGANTMEVTKSLEAALAELQPVFAREGITLDGALHRPATFIEASLANISHSLLLGAALVAVVLFIFLGHVRTALISLTAIPLSLLGAVAMLQHLHVSLNSITLGGLAIAIGAVVDDAIIDVENIVRRLRENREREQPRPVLNVVLDASLEVRSAIVFATFIVALVFLPVLTLTGLQGSFFAPLATSYILAIMTSLLVALTVTPALTLLVFRRGTGDARMPWLQRCLRAGYERILQQVARRPVVVIGTVAVFCVVALSRLAFLGGEFLPAFREGHFVLQVTTVPGTSIAEMLRIGGGISRKLLAISEIATVEQQVGRAELSEDTWGPHRCEFHVELQPDLPGLVQARVQDDIRAVLSAVPGIQFEVTTFLGDRIGESISGETAPVVINLFGEDLDVLDAKANEVAHTLAQVSGATDVQVKAPPGAPRVAVRLRPERLTQLGLRPVEVLDAIQTAYQGSIVGQVYRGNQVTDIAVTLDQDSRQDPENVGALLLHSTTGRLVPLREVAEVYETSGRFSILHDGARRRQTVTCQPVGRDVQSLVDDARRVLAEQVHLPANTYLEFSGAAQAQTRATHELLLHASVAGIGIVLLLAVVLGHWKHVLLVLVNLPLALAGGVLAVYLNGLLRGTEAGTLSMGALVGFVTLFGITTRNAIMLLSHYAHLVTQENQPWNLATAIRGASERLIPILMTAAVTALGLLPLALGSGEAGREIEGPMAVVILGGLLTSSGLNLLVLPTLALRTAHWTRNAPANPASPVSATI